MASVGGSGGTTSVDGLISGLDTTSLIQQLMQIAAQPQTQLKKAQSVDNTKLAAYQSINTRTQAVQTAAEALTDPSAWTAAAVSSSSSSVTATATPGATTGSFTFDVLSTAKAQSVFAGSAMANLTDTVASAGSVTIAGSGGSSVTTGGSLQDMVNDVNKANIGVRAVAVQVSPGSYRMQLTSTTTGSASTFSVSGLSTSTIQPAANAKIDLGNSNVVESATNTFTGVLSGVTFTVSQPQTGVTLNVSPDTQSMSSKIQSLVDALNGANSQITLATAYTPGSSTSSPLTGDYAARRLSGQLTSVVSGINDPASSLSQLGIQVDRYGKVTYDSTKFMAAYAANPASVKTLGTLFGSRADTVAKSATDPTSGTLTNAIAGVTSDIKRLTSSIADWDTRLAGQQQALKTKYSAMEVALGKLQSQSNWLAGQINSLPTSSSR